MTIESGSYLSEQQFQKKMSVLFFIAHTLNTYMVEIDYIFREDILIIDMLVRHHCMREEDMGNLLKFDKKLIRAKIAGLKKDKLIQEKPRMESRADDPTKVEKMNCYFINYKIFVNVVKYKLNHMLKKVKKQPKRCN